MADTAKYVAVVFDGDGFQINVRTADTAVDAQSEILPLYLDAQAAWELTDAADRVPDPPMWDVYERIRDEATVMHPANLGAL